MTNEQLEKLSVLVQAAPGATAMLQIMDNVKIMNHMMDEDTLDADNMKEFQVSIRVPASVFYEVLKNVDESVELVKKCFPMNELLDLPSFQNAGLLPSVLGHIFMFGIRDLLNDRAEHKKQLLKIINEMYEQIKS